MKKILLLLSVLIYSEILFAQTTEDEAKLLYNQAEEKFENSEYTNCYALILQSEEKLGKPNAKTHYLLIRGFYNSLFAGTSDKSGTHYEEGYQNLAYLLNICSQFFGMIDKDSYPKDKYQDILTAKLWAENEIKKYANEKDRKPQDAVDFLNTCAQKFSFCGNKKMTVEFSLDGSVLIIKVIAKSMNEYKIKWNRVGKEETRIDLSKVWIESKLIEAYPYEVMCSNGYQYHQTEFDNRKYSSNRVDLVQPHISPKNLPLITSQMITIENKSYCEKIVQKIYEHMDKDYEFDDADFEREKFQNVYKGFYVWDFFCENSDEYKNSNYHDRIYKAYDFLINYFGGGKKPENREAKSKF